MLEQVAEDSRGNRLYVEPNEVGGHRYLSDDIGGGVVIWDTSLASIEMLELAIKHEKEMENDRANKRRYRPGSDIYS